MIIGVRYNSFGSMVEKIAPLHSFSRQSRFYLVITPKISSKPLFLSWRCGIMSAIR